MTIELNPIIVPAQDKDKSARCFADIFGLQHEGPSGHFAPVRVNDKLTLNFDCRDRTSGHYAARRATIVRLCADTGDGETQREASWRGPSDRTSSRGSDPFLVLLDENRGISGFPETRMEG